MARSRAFHLSMLALGVTAVAAAPFLADLLPSWPWLESLQGRLAASELRTSDWLAIAGRKTPTNDRIIFLAIDSTSMLDPVLDLEEEPFTQVDRESAEGLGLQAMASAWPWPRSVYARIMDRLFDAGAAVVAFDLTFPKSSADDAAFRGALEKYRDRVVIASNFDEGARIGFARAYKRPAETIIPASAGIDERVGFAIFESEERVRGATFHARDEGDGEMLPSFATQIVRKLGRGATVPGDTREHPLRLTGGPGEGFQPHSIFEIFVPEYWQQNYRGGEMFRGAVVVVGAAGNWQHDVHPTALGEMPGPELQCNTVNALLHDGLLRRSPLWLVLALIAAGGSVSYAFNRWILQPIARLALLVVGVVAYAAAALACYNHADLILPLLWPVGAFAVNGFGGLVYDLVMVRNERRRLRATFERYVSKNVVGELMEDSRSYLHALGGEVRPVTILFSDIRNFTRVCATTEPTLLVQLLNEYLTVMVDCVFRHGGTLDKFIGDALMAVWGNVRSQGPREDARQALRCALAMQQELATLNQRWAREGRAAFEIGLALNHGDVVAGSIGSPHRMEVTVIGDAVNVCWRLQERTKQHPNSLLLGASLVDLLEPEHDFEPLGTLTVGETIEEEYYGLAEAHSMHEKPRELATCSGGL